MTTPTIQILTAAVLVGVSGVSNAASLCKPTERIVFSCSSGAKVASLCAVGNLQTDGGRLIYRFGRDRSHVELEHGGSSKPASASYSFNYSPWAKGQSSSVGFKRGKYVYVLNHAAGAFGVDGGDNVASIGVWSEEKEISKIACHEPSTVDHMYEELSELGLPNSPAD